MRAFWSELRRRNVIKVGVAYAVIAWLLIQVVDVVLPTFEAPQWVLQTITFLLILGFPLAVGLAWAFDVTPDGVRRTPAAEPRVSDKPGLADSGQAGSSATAPSQHQPAPRNSIAVLPFANISPREEDAYFAVGLHEEILNHLAKIRALSVISRTSVLRFADATLPVPQIAAELNVSAIMEGSVRYSGKRIRITAQLIDAATDRHLWSETYDREFEDIFAIESDVAVNVAQAMQATFSAAEREAIERAATKSSEAYALYLQAWALYATGESTPGIDARFDRAIALDPDFALAHAFKAWRESERLTNTMVGAAVSEADREKQQRLVTEHARRALAVDANVPYASGALADMQLFGWHWTEAADAYERALKVAPHDAIARGYYGFLKAMLGRTGEAVELQRRSIELNPGQWPGHLMMGFHQGYAKDFPAAIAELRRALELAPRFPLAQLWLAYMEIASGDAAAAKRSLATAEEWMGTSRPPVAFPELVYAYSRLNEPDDVARVYAEIESFGADTARAFGVGGKAMVHIALGEHAEALIALKELAGKAARHQVDAGFINAMNLKLNVMEDPALKEPRFQAALGRITGD